ncbi:hypothetical protein DL93DRAFT_2095693 [Clavulina sp. PMI_390]|nr:hypothetical protein DL93DRAFT_2095693 [Clavulina sp. PMI_390]
MDRSSSPSWSCHCLHTEPVDEAQRRQHTLISLIDDLVALRDRRRRKDDEVDLAFESKLGPDSDSRQYDDRTHEDSISDIKSFQTRVKGLDKELQGFIVAVRQLGSSVGLISSAFQLRARFAQILYLFQLNASTLFDTPVDMAEPVWRSKYLKQAKHKTALHELRPIIEFTSDPEAMPIELKLLADDFSSFLGCLNQIPEYDDEIINPPIISFQKDLNYWASCLQDFRGIFFHGGILLILIQGIADQFQSRSIKYHVHDLALEMEEHIESITQTLTTFVNTGVSAIHVAQKRKADYLQSLSTVATFFSAVTASTLQYSLASAINGQLAFHWRSAVCRSPEAYVPCSFAVITVGFWFLGERYAYSKTEGTKWFGQILDDIFQLIVHRTGLSWLLSHLQSVLFIYVGRWIAHRYRGLHERVRQVLHRFSHPLSRASTTESSLETGHSSADVVTLIEERASHRALPEQQISPQSPLHVQTLSDLPMNSPLPTLPLMSREPRTIDHIVQPQTQRQLAVNSTLRGIPQQHAAHSVPLPELHPLPLHREAPNSEIVITSTAAYFASTSAQTPVPRETLTAMPRPLDFPTVGEASISVSTANEDKNQIFEAPSASRRSDESHISPEQAKKPSRLGSVAQSLRSLRTRETLNEHNAPVYDLQFSPDGRFCEAINPYLVNGGTTVHSLLEVDTPGGVRGSSGLVSERKGGVCMKTIERAGNFTSIAWMPHGTSFLLLEGTNIQCFGLDGSVEWNVDIVPQLDKFVIAPDGERLVGIIKMEVSPRGLHPSKSRIEKRIIAYNFKTKTIESQVPVFNEVYDITISAAGNYALITYVHGVPPQLFRINKLRDHTTHLLLAQTYKHPSSVDFADSSYQAHFLTIGTEDSLVLCAGKDAKVFIWDRESARFLHSLQVHDQSSDITKIAWNHASESQLMFASATCDGKVKVWTAPLVGSE